MGRGPKAVAGRSLAEAFGIGKRELVSIVGGGGKTTLMYSLLNELSKNSSAAAATTTKIFAPGPDEVGRLVCGRDLEALVEGAGKVTDKPPVFGGGLLPEDKVVGIDPKQCDALFEDECFDYLIVEADGARRKPLKAPGPLEPVVPSATTLFIAVVGLSCLGQPLGEDSAFRPELVEAVTGLKAGEPITAGSLAGLLLHEGGLRKGCPPGAKRAVLLNQADTPAQKRAAQEIAATMLGGESAWERVVIGHLLDDEPIEEIWLR